MNKKVLALLMSLLIMLALPIGMYSFAAETNGNFKYEISAGNATIVGYTGKSANVAIPSKIGSATVRAIGDNAFASNKNIKSVTVPNTVTSVGEYSFSDCSNLQNVTLPSTVKSLGEGAFSGCISLSGVNIPKSLKSIPLGAFYLCMSLKSVNIPSGVTKIEEQAFAGCIALKSLYIPANVKTVGPGAFIADSGLTSVTIADGVASIDTGAFSNCTSLKAVKIPSSVKSIGEMAFGYNAIDEHTVKKIAGFTVSGAKGTAAEKYAKANGFKFIDLTAVKLNKTSITLGVGESFKLVPTNSTGYKWSANNAAVAVSGGKITAKRVGSATVTVKAANGTYATCKVTVKRAPTSIRLNKTAITIGVGEQFDLDSYIDKNTAAYSRPYTSGSPVIANVTSAGGIVTGKRAGVTTVTVKTYNGKVATCKVTVKDAPTSISLNKISITMGVGEQFDFDSYVNKGAASRVCDYTTGNASVVSVAKAGGLATAKNPGTALITVTTYNGKTATCAVTVKKAPTSIRLNKTKITLGVGEQFDLDSYVNAGAASYRCVYSGSNTTVATVAKAGGLVTAKKPGTMVATVRTYNGKTATCTVTVKKAPVSIRLNKTSITLEVGEKYQLASYVNSGAASFGTIYSSNFPAVATVSAADGTVTANKGGTAIIRVTTYNGKTATCKVVVKQPQNFTMTPEEIKSKAIELCMAKEPGLVLDSKMTLDNSGYPAPVQIWPEKTVDQIVNDMNKTIEGIGYANGSRYNIIVVKNTTTGFYDVYFLV